MLRDPVECVVGLVGLLGVLDLLGVDLIHVVWFTCLVWLLLSNYFKYFGCEYDHLSSGYLSFASCVILRPRVLTGVLLFEDIGQ